MAPPPAAGLDEAASQSAASSSVSPPEPSLPSGGTAAKSPSAASGPILIASPLRNVSPPTPAPSPQPEWRLLRDPSQQTGDALHHTPPLGPPGEETLMHTLTTGFSRLDAKARRRFLTELVSLCDVGELAHLSQTISPRLKVDFLSQLPIEISLHILSFIYDPRTLARAACVSRFWRSLVNDESTWKAMCLKHRFADDRPGMLLSPRLAGDAQMTDVFEDDSPSADAALARAPEYYDPEGSTPLVELYRGYRARGLDPSSALHELRTLHDLFLAKQGRLSGGVARLSDADRAFYRQLEEIVEKEEEAGWSERGAAAAMDEMDEDVGWLGSQSRSRDVEGRSARARHGRGASTVAAGDYTGSQDAKHSASSVAKAGASRPSLANTGPPPRPRRSSQRSMPPSLDGAELMDLSSDAASPFKIARSAVRKKGAVVDSEGRSLGLGTPSSSAQPRSFSYRNHFKMQYLTESNWLRGGRLLAQHTSADDEAVVTSLAMDDEWIVVGMANSKIHVFDARTGLFASTLAGHENGVWCLTLISRSSSAKTRSPHRHPTASEAMADKQKRGKSRRQSRPLPDADLASSSSSRTSAMNTHDPSSFSAQSRPFSSLSASTSRLPVGPGFSFVSGSTTSAAAHHPDSDDQSVSGLGLSEYAEGVFAEHHAGGSRSASFSGFGPGSTSALDLDSGGGSARRQGPSGRSFSTTDAFGGPHSSDPREVPTQAREAVSAILAGARGNVQPSLCGASTGYGNEGAIVVSGGCDRDVRVWDVETGACKHVLRGHSSTVRCLKVLDGRPIAISGSRDGTLRVWDVDAGRSLHVLRGHQESVRCLEVAGNKVVSGSYDATCRVWDVDAGTCLHTLQGHLYQIYAVAFDGQYVVTGSLDTTVRVWSAETGECLALFQGHTQLVGQLQLTDSILVTGGSDGRVIVFSLHTMECLHRLCAHDNSVTCLQFDGRFLVTGGNDGKVKLWDFKTGAFIRELCEPSEAVWKVTYRDDKCVVLCRRGNKTSMEVFSYRPTEFS